jgi:hypothetical protein
LTPNDKTNSFNNIDFSNVGNSISKDSNAFKKIQKFSKLTTLSINREASLDIQVFNKINNIYANPANLNHDNYFYGNPRQHNLTSLDSFLPSFSTLVNKNGLKKFINYSLNIESSELINSSSNFFKSNFYDQQNINKNIEQTHNLKGDNILKVNNILIDNFSNSNVVFSK